MVFTRGPTPTARRQAALKARFAKSAAAQVFGAAELLEDILIRLPIGDILLNANRVCKRWNDVIENSPKLQHALFFTPLPGGFVKSYGYWEGAGPNDQMGPVSSNMVYRRFWAQSSSAPAVELLRNPFIDGFHELKVRYQCDLVGGLQRNHHKQKVLAIDREDASWRRMLVCQPAVKQVDGFCGPRPIKNWQGVRMDEIFYIDNIGLTRCLDRPQLPDNLREYCDYERDFELCTTAPSTGENVQRIEKPRPSLLAKTEDFRTPP